MNLGRTRIHTFKVIEDHLKVEFPTKNGVGHEKDDHRMIRSCYVSAVTPGGVGGNFLQ